ncbi:myosin-10-like [Corticium candelabrum]|uniref:myosin-10-like n=1 Tax=Corticium candelabrum TaxID=121492 RepID=UPI002E274DCF|nr:myosin-10-like [Corticium candelabrum]
MEDWQRYRPQHELPADVQTLPRDETVCKFCGVSYLIHNEIKKLEEKVQFLERQLQHYEGYDRREEELKKKLEDTLNEKGEAGLKLEKERTRHLRTSSELKEQQQIVEELVTSKKVLQSQIVDIEGENIKRREKILCLTLCLSGLKEKVQLCREALLFARQLFADQSKATSDYVVHAREEMKRLISRLSAKMIELSVAREDAMATVTKREDELKETNIKLLHSSTTLSNLEKDKKKLSDHLRLTEQRCEELLEAKQKLQTEAKEYQITMTSLGQEVERLQTQLQRIEEVTSCDKERFVGKVKKLETSVETMNSKCSSLEEQVREHQVLVQTWKAKNMTIEGEATSLKSSLTEAQNNLKIAREENEKLIGAHHARLEQLRESYQEKRHAVEELYRQQEEKLDLEGRKNREECHKLRNKLREANEVMLKEAERKKIIQTSSRLLQSQNDELSEQLTLMKSDHSRVIQQLRGEIAKEKATSEAALGNHISETRHLRSQLLNLQQQLEVSLTENEGMVKCLAALEKKHGRPADTSLRTQELRATLEKASEEIKFLRSTVQSECEERIRLTEALEAARLQLHEVQRRNLASTSSLSSHSVSTTGQVTRKQSTASTGGRTGSAQLDVNRRRIEAAMGRSSRTGKC